MDKPPVRKWLADTGAAMGVVLLCCACNAATGFPYCYAELYVFTELLRNIPASVVRYIAPPDSSRLSVCNKRITNDPRSAIRVNLVSPISKCSCLHLCRAVKYATPTTPHPMRDSHPTTPRLPLRTPHVKKVKFHSISKRLYTTPTQKFSQNFKNQKIRSTHSID